MAFQDMLSQFGQRVGGLLDPEAENYLANLPANPMFGAGMGILAANADPNQNVFQGALAGLQGARATQQEEEERARQEELRRRLGELFQQQMAQPGGMTPGGMTPGAPGLPGTPLQSPYQQMSETDRLLREFMYGGQNYG